MVGIISRLIHGLVFVPNHGCMNNLGIVGHSFGTERCSNQCLKQSYLNVASFPELFGACITESGNKATLDAEQITFHLLVSKISNSIWRVGLMKVG